MPNIDVVNLSGKKVSTLELNEFIFASKIYEQALYEQVRLIRANSRQDTAKTKKRDEVSGGGRKPWRQKGTGHARQGSTRSPQWRHGGIVFGPSGEQNHKLYQNRKEKMHALFSALTLKVAENKIIVIDDLAFDKSKTKNGVALLKELSLTDKKVAVVLDYKDETSYVNTVYSFTNLQKVNFIGMIEELNAFDVLNVDYLLIDQKSIARLQEEYL